MPDIADTVFDLVDRIVAAATPAEAWNVYMAAARDAGFTHGTAFIDVVDDALPHRCYADTMPQGWMAEYSARKCRRMDAVADHIAYAVTPFEFRIADWRDDDARRPWHDLDRDSGIDEGLIIPFRTDGALRAIALCGRAVTLHPHTRKALEYSGTELLLRLRALGAFSQDTQGHLLSERERECLRWAAAGKSDWEIGEILTLSEKTVNVYVERAKHKLRATTRVQAVVCALRCGAISL